MGEGDDGDADPAAPARQDLRQIQHLLLGLRRGIGIAEEMHAAKLHAPLCHHPARHGGIDPAAEQQHPPSGGAHRQAARAGDGPRADKGVILPDLHLDGDLGILHLRLQMIVKIAEIAAHLPADFRRGQGKALVRPAGLHLIGADARQRLPEIFSGLLLDILNILFADHRPADAHHAKHLPADLQRPIHGDVFVLGLHINGGLAAVDLEIAHLFQPPVERPVEPLLKLMAIQALEHQLAALTKQNFSHMG